MIILPKFSNFPNELSKNELRKHELSRSDCTWKSRWKKHWKNGENTGKVDEKILGKCEKYWKSL